MSSKIADVPIEDAENEARNFTERCKSADFVESASQDALNVPMLIRGTINMPTGDTMSTSVFCYARGEDFRNGLEIRGRGEDNAGMYSVWGILTLGAVSTLEFAKVYDGQHTVLYRGSAQIPLQHSGFSLSTQMSGQWNIPGNWCGTFDFELHIFDNYDDGNLVETREIQTEFRDYTVLNVDTVRMEYSVKCCMQMSWRLDRKTCNKLALGLSWRNMDVQWHPPAPKITNAVGEIVREIGPVVVKLQEVCGEPEEAIEATVVTGRPEHTKDFRPVQLQAFRETTMTLTLRDTFELKNFPFDCQDLVMHMIFEPPRNQSIPLSFVFGKNALHMTVNPGELPEFTLHRPVIENWSRMEVTGIDFDLKPVETEVHHLCIRAKAARNHWMYIHKMVIQLSSIQTCGVAVFFLDAKENFGDRLGFAATTLLAAIAFQYLLQQYLPNIDYLTHLDMYVMVVDVHLCIIILQCCLQGFFEPENEALNVTLLLINFAAVFIIIVVFGIISHGVRTKEKQKLEATTEQLKRLNVDEQATEYVVGPVQKVEQKLA